MKKRQLVPTYNANHKLPAGYNITGVMVLTDEQVDARKKYGKKSLFEVYKKPSQLKIEADEENAVRAEKYPQEVAKLLGEYGIDGFIRQR